MAAGSLILGLLDGDARKVLPGAFFVSSGGLGICDWRLCRCQYSALILLNRLS